MPEAVIKFYGVRGSLARPSKSTMLIGGNTPCVTVEYGKDLVICDTGTGIYELGQEMTKKRSPVKAAILYSHYHWDHMIGLPFFAPVYDKKNSLTIIGKKGLRKAINNLLRPPNFPVKLGDMSAKIRLIEKDISKFSIGEIIIEAFEVNHPNGAFGYKFHFPNKKTAVFISDNGPEINNIKLIDRIYGTDLLIHDAQYLPDEYLAKKKFGHSTFNYVLDISRGCKIKKIALFHHDPARTDSQIKKIETMARGLARKIGLSSDIFAAKEKHIIRL